MNPEQKRDPEPAVPFAPSKPYSLGVEVEFQTLDTKSLNLSPLAPTLLANAPTILRPRLSHEFIQSILEIKTGVCRSVIDVENDLLQTCALAEELAEENNCLLYAASLHPFASSRDQVLTNDDRYERIMDELQIVGRRFIPQGIHIHTGLPDGDTAMRVCNAIQLFLPLFLSLSHSSPYFQGEDTGLMSYRTKLFEVLPLAGIYEHMDSWHHFQQEVAFLRAQGVIKSIRDIWWDVRPHADFGTLEMRICDLPTRFNDILGLVALIQATVATLVHDFATVRPYSHQILRWNKWQAVRYGLKGSFVDPTGFLSAERLSVRQAVERLLVRVQPMVEQFETTHYIDLLRRILDEGTGADRQRQIFTQSGDFKQVIRNLHREFWQ